jgi:hypothetical protein
LACTQAVSDPQSAVLTAHFPKSTHPKPGRVICNTTVRVDRTGTPLSAMTEEENDCTPRFASIADHATMKARWEPRHRGFESTVPVFIDHDAKSCARCVTVTVAPK